MQHDYDVVIVGAGIIGLSLALGLARQSFSVAIVDKAGAPQLNSLKASAEETNKADEQAPRVYSSRVSAISSASELLLNRLGAWDSITRMQTYTHMQVWDKDGFGAIAFDNTPALGHIIENDVLNSALYTCLQNQSNVTCFFNTNITDMQANDSKASVNIERVDEHKSSATSTITLNTKLIVGADGANSQVRERFGFKHTFWDYDHSAIVANVTTQSPHNNTAMQAFTPYGPLAFLPLPDSHQCSIVFSQQSEHANTLMALDDQEFAKSLQVTIDNRYGNISLNTERMSFPLRMRYARKWTNPHIAIIGDAAHTIHPLAGQGANLGLADVDTLLKLIAQCPEKIGEYSQLRKYERCRKAEAIKVIASMQGFKTLFDGNHPAKKLLRNLGLLGADKLPGVKQFFIKQAMG